MSAWRALIAFREHFDALERTWHRANTELRRARAQAEPAPEGSFDKYLDFLCAKPAPGELASLRQSAHNDVPDCPAAATPPRDWLPTDEKTGRPLYFVG